MWPFEKEICQHLEEQGISFQYEEASRRISSAKVNIRFLPNLSDPQAVGQIAYDGETIYLWEDIFKQKKVQVLSRINALLRLNKRVHGRQTSLQNLDKQQYANFLQQHHLMGATTARYRVALMLNDDIVAVAGFGRECPIDYQGKTYRSHELIRFCNKTGFTVVGGLSKLINHFVVEHKVEHLMTYVDREWSSGQTYTTLGFELIEVTPPQNFYLSTEDHRRYRLAELQAAGIDKNKCHQLSNLGNNKFVRIFTA